LVDDDCPDAAMKVALNAEPLFQRVATGTGVYTLALCQGYADLGLAEHVVLFHAEHPLVPPDVAALPMTRHDFGIPREVLYKAWSETRRPSPQAVTGPVDVIHAPGPAVPPGGGAPVVATVHDLAPLRFAERYPREARIMLKRGVQMAAREAARIICPSSFTAHELRQFLDVEQERVRVVPHGVGLPTIDTYDAGQFVSSRGITEPYVLWIGTQEERKNVLGVLEAFARVHRSRADVRLVLHGPQGWLGESVAESIRHRGLASSTLVSEGGLTRRELAWLYSRASVFVFPSIYEGFGLPVLEAMASGTPVVTSDRSALPESAGDAALLVDPSDADAIAAAVLELLEDDTRRETLVEKGRVRASEFTWQATATRTWSIYEELIE
jgi:glycosyltransferase involved in cell wall biosynthesis